LPRLAGPVNDANRGGFVLVFYLVVLSAAELRPWVRRLAIAFAVIFLALTFSRSAILAAAATLSLALLTRRQWFSPRFALAASIALVCAALFLLARPSTFRQIDAVLQSPAASRLSANEGSAQSHLALIQRGFAEATRSLRRSAVGLGYGDSYLVLQDVFPANRYGNFHSLYVTMFAEAGILALILTLVMMGAPLVAGGPWRAMIAGTFAFNVFYQTTTEPVFWFILACAWLTMPPGAWTPGAWSRRDD
jgi:O-antigen ligase